MATQVTNYQCPACTGPLQYSSQSGKLECEYCESKFTVEEVEAFYAAQDEKAAEAMAKEEAAQAAAPGETDAQLVPETQWDFSELSDDWGADAAQMKAYNCPSCGAELICDGTTAATSCPYCGNNTIVPGQFALSLKPDLILPFQLDKDAAIAALKKHYQGKFLLPKAFTAGNHLKEIQGVYVPFWLYDAAVEIDAHFDGVNVKTTVIKDYEVTDRDHYDAHRQGVISYTGVPVDGSRKMADDYMDSLEPFDYAELKPFSTAYLPGYLADRYDQTARQCAKRADSRCENSAVKAMQATVLGYDTVSPSGHNVNIQRGKVRYALLPVWVLHTKWEDKDYLFMMNGQTGKLVGDLPIDEKKAKLTRLALTALLAVVLQVTTLGPVIAKTFVDWFFNS